MVQTKLERIYQEMPGPHQIDACGGFWSRLYKGYTLTLQSLKEISGRHLRVERTLCRRLTFMKYLRVCLHDVPPNERNGAKLGTWIGLKV